jgi:hypothetical protein
MRWKTCLSCDEEYQVIGGSIDSLDTFCPFCGVEVENEEDEEEFEEEDE